MADNDEAIQLRRRARRRLVGAIALVVLAVIVLPIVFDKEPKPVSQDIVIQIPSQNSGKFNSKVLPSPEISKPEAIAPDKAAPDARAEPAKPAEASGAAPVARVPEAPKAEVAAKPAAEAKKDASDKPAAVKSAPPPAAKAAAPSKEAARPPEKAAGTDGEAARAQAALQAEGYVVPLGAFLNQANVKTLQGKVAQAGIKSYSEVQNVAKGEQIRVRAGPFPTREAAERAREQLQAAGLTVGPVTKL